MFKSRNTDRRTPWLIEHSDAYSERGYGEFQTVYAEEVVTEAGTLTLWTGFTQELILAPGTWLSVVPTTDERF